MKRLDFGVDGMSCAACSAAVERVIKRLDGVSNVVVNLTAARASVLADENKVTLEKIAEVVKKAGFSVRPLPDADEQKKIADQKYTDARRRLFLCAIFAIPLFFAAMFPMLVGWTPPKPYWATSEFALCLPVLFFGRQFYTSGFPKLFRGHPNMDSLVAVGTSAAVIYSIWAMIRGMDHLYFESAAMIITLVQVGRLMELRSRGKTNEAVRKLTELSPRTATVERAEGTEVIPVDELMPGDIVLVRPGEAIAADGCVESGETAIDESMLTGEFIPVQKHAGDAVFTATMNKNGAIRVRVTHTGAETALAGIIRAVENAQGTKAPAARFADKVAGIFVPIVMSVAVLTAIAWLIVGKSAEFAIEVGISVLVIACPCALGLATPIAITVATGMGARRGILFRSAEALERTANVTVVAFDKTGTVTLGAPEVTKCGLSDEILVLTASAENQSSHPLAETIVRHAVQRGLSLLPVDEFENHSGLGIVAKIDGRRVVVGNEKMLNQFEIATENAENNGQTTIYVAIDGEYNGTIEVADPLRTDSVDAIERLKKLGVRVALISGDNVSAAERAGKIAGFDEIYAGVLPEKKAEIVKDLGGVSAMVGDGINDAPALVTADVGIAVGTGMDIAIESADVVLMRHGVFAVSEAIVLARATMHNIRQNLAWAFGYNIIGIPIAAGVLYLFGGPLLNPMIAAAAMSLSSVSVVMNAVRLGKYAKNNNGRKGKTDV